MKELVQFLNMHSGLNNQIYIKYWLDIEVYYFLTTLIIYVVLQHLITNIC